MIVSELLIGALIGLMARLYILALQFIGAGIAMLIGYGGMSGPGIEDAEPQAALASIISFSALLLLFVFDFHHEIIKALVASYDVAPINVLFNPQAALVDVTDTISESFMVVIRLGSPFIAYAMLVNLAIGFVNKLMPQIPVYFISLPFVIAGGLIILYFAIPTHAQPVRRRLRRPHHREVGYDHAKRTAEETGERAGAVEGAARDAPRRLSGRRRPPPTAKRRTSPTASTPTDSLSALFPDLYHRRIDSGALTREDEEPRAGARRGRPRRHGDRAHQHGRARLSRRRRRTSAKRRPRAAGDDRAKRDRRAGGK